MSKFKVGDKVKVLSIPGIWDGGEVFVESYDKDMVYVTGTFTVTGVHGDFAYNHYEINGPEDFQFGDKDLELV